MKIDFTSNKLISTQTVNSLPKSNEEDFSKILDKAIQDKDDKKLYDTCVQLESVFLSKVLDAMRASIPRSDFINRGFATETFESMLFDEYSKEISKSSSTGIAEILYKQLKNK